MERNPEASSSDQARRSPPDVEERPSFDRGPCNGFSASDCAGPSRTAHWTAARRRYGSQQASEDEGLIRLEDEALYRAKGSSRNRTEISR